MSQPADDGAPGFQQNFLVLVFFQVLQRIGWIVKTESIIMPAVLDSLGGPGWLRGCLPMLNRMAQSLAPLLLAQQLALAPRKKWALLLSSLGMAITLLLLAFAWSVTSVRSANWMPALFLLLYTLFVASTGINQVSYGALQGKLIPITLRGRLLATANTTGGVLAIISAWLLFPMWLSDITGYTYIFTFAGACFAFNTISTLLLRESADSSQSVPPRLSFRLAWQLLNADWRFRRAALAGFFFGASLILFPHYQALARVKLGLPATAMSTWVIVENVGTACFSALVGPIADRYGNRLALRCLLLALVIAPLLALALVALGTAASPWYTMVFWLVGVTPVGLRVFDNYVLELTPRAQHAQYLSLIAVVIASPILLAPFGGWLIERTGFMPVFLVVSAAVGCGFLVTFALAEPRSGPDNLSGP
jgi:hypothetical protein